MGWKHYQTVHPSFPQKNQVGRGLFGAHLLILHFKFRLSKSIKSSTFHIHFNLINLSCEKKYLFSKMPENHPKLTQNHQTVVNEISREIQGLHRRDIQQSTTICYRQPNVIDGQKTVCGTGYRRLNAPTSSRKREKVRPRKVSFGMR